MKNAWIVFLVACGGTPKPKPEPKPTDHCTAANQQAVEQGVELERDENSDLYTTLSSAEIDCARRAVRSSEPLAPGAPACLQSGRVLTTAVAAIVAGTSQELPAQTARDALVQEVGAVPEPQRAGYLLEQLNRAYDCGGDLALDGEFWNFVSLIESSIEACKCTIDAPRLQLLAWYFHGGGGDWPATAAERAGP